MAQSRKVQRSEVRESIRPEIRGRDGQILTRRPTGTSANQFHVPESLMEAGWSMQWVRAECLGKADPANITDHMENGWTPVPASRKGFSEFFRTGGAEHIEREGLILMERPVQLTEQALAEDYAAAMNERNAQVEEFALSDLPMGFDKGYGKAQKRVKRGAPEGIPLDSYPQRQIAIGDDE